nr:MAG TPA: Receptor Binding Protein [Caudoviricetes sp.]
MAITSGFFDSVNGDRKYSAQQFGNLFTGIISDGVFSGVGGGLKVESRSSQVYINSGRAWCRGTWLDNDAYASLNVPANSHPNYSRYDAVVLTFDTSSPVRRNSIDYISGVAAATPLKPTLKNDSLTKQMPLCYIFRPANSTTITQSNIESTIGTSACPYITGPLKTIDVTDVVRDANATIRDTNQRLQQVTTELEQKARKLDQDVTATKNSFTDWVTNAEKALGSAPNASTIIEAKKVADQAVRTANSASSTASSAMSNVTVASSAAHRAEQKADGVVTQFNTLKQTVTTEAAKITAFDSRIRAAEEEASSARNLMSRVQVLEGKVANATSSYEPVGVARNFYVREGGRRNVTSPPSGWEQDLRDGKFKLWAINDRIITSANGQSYEWIVAAFDYYYPLQVLRHHILLVAADWLLVGPMSTAGTMPKAYSTDTTLLQASYNPAASQLQASYGAGAGFTFSEYASSAVGENGRTTSGTDVLTRFMDMCETQVFGHQAWGNTTRFDMGYRSDQIPLFNLYPDQRKCNRGRYWLRNFLTPTIMMGVDEKGRSDGWTVSQTGVGRRPYMLLGA